MNSIELCQIATTMGPLSQIFVHDCETGEDIPIRIATGERERNGKIRLYINEDKAKSQNLLENVYYDEYTCAVQQYKGGSDETS